MTNLRGVSTIINYAVINLRGVSTKLNKYNDKSEIAHISKACWMSKGGGGLPNSDNDGQGGEGEEDLTFCRTSFVNGP